MLVMMIMVMMKMFFWRLTYLNYAREPPKSGSPTDMYLEQVGWGSWLDHPYCRWTPLSPSWPQWLGQTMLLKWKPLRSHEHQGWAQILHQCHRIDQRKSIIVPPKIFWWYDVTIWHELMNAQWYIFQKPKLKRSFLSLNSGRQRSTNLLDRWLSRN